MRVQGIRKKVEKKGGENAREGREQNERGMVSE
jgi:hypothetical protein